MSGPTIAVVDYGIGNLRSAQKALERVGADALLTDDSAVIEAAAAVVLPGVGAFGRCMEALRDSGLAGVTEAAAREARDGGRPFLGICVGLQMLCRASEESPGVAGLAVLDGEVRLLPDSVKRPQMQWNVVRPLRPSRLLPVADGPVWAYFVHSYAAEMTEDAVAVCDYGGDVVAAVERGNLFATQFHPEKSGATGLAVLSAFVQLTASAPVAR